MICLVNDNVIVVGPVAWSIEAILEPLLIAGYDVRDGILYGPNLAALGPAPDTEPTGPLALGAYTVLPVVEVDASASEGKILAGREAVITGDHVKMRPVWGDLPPAPPDPTLEDLILSKTTAIQATKVSARDAGFDVGGVHFDSDASARISYGELSDMLKTDPAYTTPWRASSGAWVTMDATLYAQVQAAGAAHLQGVFAWQAARDADLAAIQAAVTAGTMTEAEARGAIEAVSTSYTV